MEIVNKINPKKVCNISLGTIARYHQNEPIRQTYMQEELHINAFYHHNNTTKTRLHFTHRYRGPN